jgi:signal transduction histidine kinase
VTGQGHSPSVLKRGLLQRKRSWLKERDAGYGASGSDRTAFPAIEAIVYFSAAELPANATKHAGTAHLTVEVSDTGRLFMTVIDED